MKDANRDITRRRFLQGTARGAGILAVSGSIASSIPLARAASPGKEANPFALDVERLRKTDPKLIHYEQVGQFASPKPDPRRIATGPDNSLYIAAADSVACWTRPGHGCRRSPAPLRSVAWQSQPTGRFMPGSTITWKCSTAAASELAVMDTPAKQTWITGAGGGTE